MFFSSVVGQASVKASLRNLINGHRAPHALMFLGKSGSGTLPLALAYVQYLMCEQKQENDACGQCKACNKTGKWIHPDVHFSYPVIGANKISTEFLPQWRTALANNPYINVFEWFQSLDAENKQGNINKEECNNIIKKLSLKTYESPYKVLLMWLPEYLGKEGNRLLKMIEEPPENTFFILVAENQELILNTILSRCQLVTISPLEDEDIIQALVQQKGLEQKQAEAITYLSDGDFNEAQRLIHQKENNHSSLFVDWMRSAYKGNGIEIVEWAEKTAAIGRENQKHFLRYGLHFLREYMLLKLTGGQSVRLLPQELEVAKNMTKVIAFEHVEQIAKLFDECTLHVERNANPKILFLDASIQLNKILREGVR